MTQMASQSRPRNLAKARGFARTHPTGLTEREDQVLRLLARGRTAPECALELGISERTVDMHRSRILDRMRAANIAHAVAIGFATGVLTPKDLR